MTQWRQFFDRLLWAGAIFMAMISLVVIVSTIRTVRDASTNFSDDFKFYTGQVEYETYQLIDHLDQFEHGENQVTQHDVQVRFDILWSRIFNENKSVNLISDQNVTKIFMTLLEQAQSTLRALESEIADLEPSDHARISVIKQTLREMIPPASRLRLAALNYNAQKQVLVTRAQLSQAYLVFTFIIGMALFGVLSILMLRTDRHEIQTMNVRLEERVRSRTEDLQAANSRLAGEIVERRRNQDLAAEREARLEQAVQLAKLGYYVWDSQSDRCEFCSDQHAVAHGLTPDEYMERASTREGLLDLIHPEDREKLAALYSNLRSGNVVETGYRIITGSGIRRLREIARPIFDSSGVVVREVGSTIDVTDQYETEMKLFEAQKMDSIGKMTGGVAHDFNNLLAVILGNLELMREMPDAHDRDEMISDAIKATLRGRDLTMSMLSFARRAPLDPSEIDLNAVIDDMQVMLRRTMPESIALEVSLAGDIWAVMADRSLTESALLNLAINARDAMPDGGKLTVETANVTLGSESVDTQADDLEPGNFVMMSVTDTGKGIGDELLAYIFEPFFTTKEITKNSGLGLSMVQGFIRQTGGTIRVNSEPGVGTSFKLFFRAAPNETEIVEDAPDPEPPVKERNLRVLLVEDDETVSKVLRRQLEQFGMSVTTAAESKMAERAFREDGPFDIVVSDIVMPGELQGPALVARLRETQPDLPAVFLSGYPQETTSQARYTGPDDVMLIKPISKDDLVAAIDVALNA